MTLKQLSPSEQKLHRRLVRKIRKRRYRSRTGANQYPRRKWSDQEKIMILAHSESDRVLSQKIKRSVNAIQKMRYVLKHTQFKGEM